MAATSRPRNPIVLNFPKSVVFKCRQNCKGALTDRQERLEWWDQRKMRAARFLLVGAGGLGSNQAKILIQMGPSRIELADPDLVESSNLNRQFFTGEDVAKPKAHQILKNLRPYAIHPTFLRGFYMPFEELMPSLKRTRYTAICCGVDSLATMCAVSRYGLETRTPVVFTNVSEDGEACRIFVQRPDEACFACYMPQVLQAPPERRGCTPVPAIADILQVAVGFGARATVAEVMGIPMGNYNCRDITFTGFDIKKTVARRPNCLLCGGK